jgi:O-antigen ligase
VVVSLLAGIAVPQNPSIPLVLAAGLLWVLLVLRAPRVALFGLGTLAVLLYLVDLQSEVFSSMLFGAYGLMLVFAVLRYRPHLADFDYDRRLVAIVGAWGIFLWLAQNLSTLVNHDWQTRYLVTSSIKLIPYLWLILAGSGMYRGLGRAQLLAGIAAGALVIAVVFLFNFRPWSSSRSALEAWTDTYLIVGSLKNSLGLLWAIGVAILLNWRAGRWQSVKTIGLLILIASIAYSFSRSSYLALLAVVLLSSTGRFWRKLLLLLLLGGAVSFLAPDVIWQRLLLTWSADRGLDLSSATRVELWWGAIRAFLDYPLTGVGIGNFTEYLVRSALMPSSAGFPFVEFTYAHNYFLSLFALTGIAGGVLGITMFWVAYRRSQILKARGDTIAATVQACLIAFFISSLYGEPLFDPVLITVFLLIIGCLIPNESEQTDAASTSNSTCGR